MSLRHLLAAPLCSALLALAPTHSAAQDPEAVQGGGYRLPPEDVVAIVDAPPTPSVSLSPDGTRMLLVTSDARPSIEDQAQPILRLAGLRFLPDRNERQRRTYDRAFEVVEIETRKRTRIRTPEGARLGSPSWAPNGTRIAFTVTRDDGVELWLAEVATGATERLVGPRLNATHGSAASWWSGAEELLVHLVPAERGATPEEPRVPAGPIVSETAGRSARNRTYQDLLADPHDETLCEHYLTSQLARVDLQGNVRPIGAPGVFLTASPSASGEYVLVRRVHRPFSYVVPLYRFAHTVEVWNRDGELVHRLVDLPVADEVPIDGVPTGPRRLEWHPLPPDRLVWAEALDGGDPQREVEHRDRLLLLQAPFTEEPLELTRVAQRFWGVDWTPFGATGLVTEYDRDRRWTTTRLHRFDQPDAEPQVLFDRSRHDRYGDPGRPVQQTLWNGRRAVTLQDGGLYLAGRGATPEGERPFLDFMHLDTGAKKRLFHSPAEAHTAFVDFALAPVQGRRALVLRSESPTSPPNYYLRRPGSPELEALTEFPDPHPQLTGIHKELLRYERADGVPLSGTLYLPPGYEEGKRLPLVVWAYPIEYTDPTVAGQVRTTTNRFTWLRGTSVLLFLTQGYAVLDGAAMPVVGDPETMNETFVEQIVAAAQAAIEACAERGVADPDRVAIGGHSYGAFMTANLLAHSDLFRAGIARSGAYNRSLTPFGFQSERRTVWEATDTYVRVSPFFQADSIDEPILLIHGEIDSNSGTFPIQSKRLYHALQGLGGTARLVLLPHESHGYAARESVLHVLAESIEWLDRYVKAAPARNEG